MMHMRFEKGDVVIMDGGINIGIVTHCTKNINADGYTYHDYSVKIIKGNESIVGFRDAPERYNEKVNANDNLAKLAKMLFE